MFDIGFPELMLSVIVGLLVIGPERLPEAMRALGLWLGRLRRSFQSVKAEIEKEIGMDEVRKQLHNEAVAEEMKRIEREVKATTSAAREATRFDISDPLAPATANASPPSQSVPEAANLAAQIQQSPAPANATSESPSSAATPAKPEVNPAPQQGPPRPPAAASAEPQSIQSTRG